MIFIGIGVLLILFVLVIGFSVFFFGLEIIFVCNSLFNRELIFSGVEFVVVKECEIFNYFIVFFIVVLVDNICILL